jgi:ABC-2 type transport system permease protein
MLCLGLSGIAVGMGAMMPNLQETSPSKIAAGFGGTLNLVLSAIYIVAVVLLTALPCHYYLIYRHGAEVRNDALPPFVTTFFWGGFALAALLGLLATWLPMRRGLQAFRVMEL